MQTSEAAEERAPPARTGGTPLAEAIAARGFLQRHKGSLSVALVSGTTKERTPKPVKPTLELQFGISGIQGRRQTMEDAHICIPATETPDVPLDAFFGVYDGHGGQKCADYIAANLHKNVISSEHFKKGEAEAALRDGIYRTESEFLAMAATSQMYDGSTAVVAMIHDTTLTVGNVGDSEAVLCRNSAPLVMSTIHNPKKNPHEAERVKAAGGRIWNHRVAHPCFNPAVMSIAVSRAFGDLGYKALDFTRNQTSGLVCEPDIMTVEIGPNDRFLLLACDGLWDVMTYEAAVEFVLKRLDEKQAPQAICESLADWALAHDSQDNITVMVLVFTLHDDDEWMLRSPSPMGLSQDLLDHVRLPGDRTPPPHDGDSDPDRLRARIRFLEEENKNKDARIQELQTAHHHHAAHDHVPSVHVDAATITSPRASRAGAPAFPAHAHAHAHAHAAASAAPEAEESAPPPAPQPSSPTRMAM